MENNEIKIDEVTNVDTKKEEKKSNKVDGTVEILSSEEDSKDGKKDKKIKKSKKKRSKKEKKKKVTYLFFIFLYFSFVFLIVQTNFRRNEKRVKIPKILQVKVMNQARKNKQKN